MWASSDRSAPNVITDHSNEVVDSTSSSVEYGARELQVNWLRPRNGRTIPDPRSRAWREAPMKWTLVIVCAALITALAIHAQSQAGARPYKVVFDLTTDDPADQTAVLRWLREVAGVSPQSEMEVVMYGRGLGLVMPER